jgi:hypothetical protein
MKGVKGFQKGNKLGAGNTYRLGTHYVMPNETKRKIGLAQKGKPESKETKLKLKTIRKNQMTQDIKDRISKTLVGKMVKEKHWNWKGGISTDIQIRVNSYEWKQIRKVIYQRDNWSCQICGVQYKDKNGRGMHVHHIIPYRVTRDNSNENLITLCTSCHMKEEYRYYNNFHLDSIDHIYERKP